MTIIDDYESFIDTTLLSTLEMPSIYLMHAIFNRTGNIPYYFSTAVLFKEANKE